MSDEIENAEVDTPVVEETEQPEVAETPETPVVETKPEETPVARRREGGWQRQIRAQDRTIALLEQQNAMLLHQMTGGKGAASADAEPDPTQYDDGEQDPKYLRAVAERAGRAGYARAAEEDRTTRAQAAEAERVEQLAQAVEAAEASVSGELADPDDVPLTRIMERYLLDEEPEIAGKVAVHFRVHPEEAWRISRLPPTKQILALGRLADLVTAAPSPSNGKATRETQAPNPMNPVKGGKGAGASTEIRPEDDALDISAWMQKHDLGLKRRA